MKRTKKLMIAAAAFALMLTMSATALAAAPVQKSSCNGSIAPFTAANVKSCDVLEQLSSSGMMQQLNSNSILNALGLSSGSCAKNSACTKSGCTVKNCDGTSHVQGNCATANCNKSACNKASCAGDSCTGNNLACSVKSNCNVSSNPAGAKSCNQPNTAQSLLQHLLGAR